MLKHFKSIKFHYNTNRSDFNIVCVKLLLKRISYQNNNVNLIQTKKEQNFLEKKECGCKTRKSRKSFFFVWRKLLSKLFDLRLSAVDQVIFKKKLNLFFNQEFTFVPNVIMNFLEVNKNINTKHHGQLLPRQLTKIQLVKDQRRKMLLRLELNFSRLQFL